MDSPARLAVLIFVLSAALGTAAGAGVPAAATSPEAPGMGLRSPFAIAVSGDRVYLTDFDGDRVFVLTRAGEVVAEWGGTGSEPGRFRGPAGVAVGPDGSVWVADHYNHRVQRFDPDGVSLDAWPAGEGSAAPLGIAVDGRGRVFVTDLDAARVSVWSVEGAPLATWGAPGRGPGELREPWGIAVDGDGTVWVADHGNHRIVSFQDDGVLLGEWAGVVGPMGITLARDGSLFVTDLSGAGARRFSRSGEPLGPSIGRAGGTPSPGLALDPAGDLFLVDPARGRMERIPATALRSVDPLPAAFALLPIVQSPGRGPVTVELAIPAPGTVAAEIFSLDGRRVHRAPAAAFDAGMHRLTWDAVTDRGHRAPAGVYFVRIHYVGGAGSITRTGRVIVLH